jgi:PEP-CTERM motif
MKVFKALTSAMFCAVGLAALCAKANAAVIPVDDPHFDMFPPGQSEASFFQVGCGTGCAFADKPVVGWTASATFQTGALSGQWQIGTATNTFNGPPIIAGTTTPELIVERDINATISQVVSTTALAGVTYTLDVDLGFDIGTRPDLAFIFLVVGGHQSAAATPLPTYGLTRAQMQGSGNWYDFQTSYTATSADAGDPIEILLSSLTGNATPTAWFADVRLVDSVSSVNPLATPEPASWAMMLIGFAGLGFAGYRRARLAV